MENQAFRFSFYRFIGPKGNRTTELVRDLSLADGMRGLVEGNKHTIETCKQKVSDWASRNGLTVRFNDPYPSSRYPGKVWIEFRFGGLTL